MTGAALADPAPTVSVLLPVYNAAKYLAASLDSILAQDLPDFELLAFDDGSTDASLTILRGHERRDPRVRVFTRPNQGLVSTLNELIGLARGRYLARMDGDDICLPHRFTQQVAFLEAHPDHVAVGARACQIDNDGFRIGTPEVPLAHAEIDADHLRGHCSIVHPAAMIVTAAMRRVDGYRESCRDAEDLDLWLRMAETGRLANLHDTLLLYRLHDGSVSHVSGQRQRASARRATEDAWRRRGVHGEFEAVEHWRPADDRASRTFFARQYGWTAWANGYRDTWRRYAWRAIRLAPFDRAPWKLLILGFLKRPKRLVP